MQRIFKILATVCLVLIAVGLYLAHSSPATGFELSIYASTPAPVWVFLIASMIGGVIIIVHQAVTKGYENSKFWLIGLLIIILAQVSLLCLPYIRGYLLWVWEDIAAHVGLVTDILSTGHFGSNNFYPVTHTLMAKIIVVTGISELTVIMLGSAFLSIMYVLSVYLLATAVLPRRGQQLLAVAATAGMPIVLSIIPIHFSILLIPLLFFFYCKRSFPAYSILLVILLILYPFFHILSSLIVIVALIVVELSRVAYTSIIKRKKGLAPMPHSKLPLNPILIESAILIPWILSFYVFHVNLRLLWQQITTGMGPDVLGDMRATLSKINIHGLDFMTLLFRMYGVEIIFIILSLIAAFILIKQIRSGNVQKETQGLFSLVSVFLFMGFLYLLFLLGAPGLQPIQADRTLLYVMVFTPILAGFGLYKLFMNTRFRYLAGIGIICVIMIASGLATFSLYDSPYVIRPNIQITQMDMRGMIWFINYKDTTIKTVDIMTPPGRFASGILGTTEAHDRVDLDRGYYYSEKVPDHFGYPNRRSLGESFSQDRYMVITKLDRMVFTTVWKEVGRFNDSDFEKLELDTTVDKLYSNGELDVYFINSLK
ncbi:MAG: hypothetical protein DDT32_00664 [Syntrophomonadaceae bacterium]|nr:hypothetical protein [Bacillota bacterium]